jgi:hypothetical protein
MALNALGLLGTVQHWENYELALPENVRDWEYIGRLACPNHRRLFQTHQRLRVCYADVIPWKEATMTYQQTVDL